MYGDTSVNFHLFGSLKEALRDQKFSSDDEVKETLQKQLMSKMD
jgi:hypothetical protein